MHTRPTDSSFDLAVWSIAATLGGAVLYLILIG
jgi:hypothetical protein